MHTVVRTQPSINSVKHRDSMEEKTKHSIIFQTGIHWTKHSFMAGFYIKLSQFSGISVPVNSIVSYLSSQLIFLKGKVVLGALC